MSDQRQPSDLSLFVSILHTLEAINAPYVIIGKLMAWTEGRARKHETDIYEMLVFHYLGLDPAITLAEHMIDREAIALGQPTADFWSAVKQAARQEADRYGEA